MRIWSSLTPPPGRGSSWKYQSSQSGPTLHWDAARELGWMGSTRSCERVRRTSVIIASSGGCLTRREITLFSPPSLCQPVELWAPRWWPPSKKSTAEAKEADKFLIWQQPALKHTWNTMVASSFWDMRLSIACAATDAEYQNRIILHDNTLNLPVVARQPHPDPNFAPRCRRLDDQPWRVVVSIPGARSSMRPLVLLAVRHLNSSSS